MRGAAGRLGARRPDGRGARSRGGGRGCWRSARRCSLLPLVGDGRRRLARRPISCARRCASPGASTAAAAFAGRARAARELVRSPRCSSGCVLAGAALALLALRLRGRLRRRPPSSPLAVALVVLDLFKAGMGYNPAIPDATPSSRPPARSASCSPSGRRASPGSTPRRRSRPLAAAPNVAMRYRPLRRARLRLSRSRRRYERLWRRYIASHQDCLYAFCARVGAVTRPRRCERSACSASPTCSRTGGTSRCGPRARAALRRARRPHLQPTRTRCRGPSWSSASAWSRGDGAALAAVNSPGFRRARRGGHRGAHPGLPEGAARRDRRPAAPRITTYEPERVVVDTTHDRRRAARADRQLLPRAGRPRRRQGRARASRGLPAPRRPRPRAAPPGRVSLSSRRAGGRAGS